MNPKRRKLLITTIFIVLGAGAAAAFALMAFQENLLYFYSPLQVAKGEAPVSRPFRLGGLVVHGSVKRDPHSLAVAFELTDTVEKIGVRYDGILPDLFREGQGIVANGSLTDGVFVASEVLAKHDENYMPPEVADAIKAAGGAVPTTHLRERQN
ncbi:MAG: cytochrome c maturation protein CcmE [Gammaproteobacteria bacterium]|nr:MAG: cytochrome c maturation protein CcmE [Gammaproteobacteria bacterium]